MNDQQVNGAELLADIEQFIRRFCILPHEHAYTAVTTWAAHTHFMEHMETTGRLACLSPEPGSGKTRVLEVLDTIAYRPLLALDLSMSAFFRIVEDYRPSILLDEVDAIFTGKAKAEGTEDLRRTINSGYRIGAKVQRVGGQNRDQVQSFRIFAPVAMAGLGNLPDNLLSRCIVLNMKRRGPGERVQPWRERLQRPEGEALQSRLSEWAVQAGELTYPHLPDGVEDRDADVWEPLVMVADAAGGDWPRRIREACKHFVASKPQNAVSLGVRLLADLREIWPNAQSSMFTADILDKLAGLDEAPWGDLYGEGLKPRKLAQILSDYGANSRNVRVGEEIAKGYRKEDLWDAWQRYLPAHDPQKGNNRHDGNAPGQTGEQEVTAPESPVTERVTVQQKRNGISNGRDGADLGKREPVTPVTDVTHSQRDNGRDLATTDLDTARKLMTEHPGMDISKLNRLTGWGDIQRAGTALDQLRKELQNR